jgi:hypothetical protein
MSNRCVYFAITDDSLYAWMAHRAIRSLRTFNKSLPIRLVIFGRDPRTAQQEHWAELDVQILTSEPDDRDPYEVKWHALRHMTDCDEVLWLDADSVCDADIQRIFDRYGTGDFWAREWPPSCSTPAISPPDDIWKKVREGIDRDLWDRLRSERELTLLPVFTTGVMLFRRGIHRSIVERLPVFSGFMDGFADGTLPYPCINKHVHEQFAASMLLGGLPGLEWGRMADADVPDYPEVCAGQMQGPWLVLQVVTALYPKYLRNTEGPAAAQAFLDRFPGTPFAKVWERVLAQ